MMDDTPEPVGPETDAPKSSESSEVVLEVQDVTKSFGPLSVLRGIDLTLRAGEVLGLVGDNGAGKSTLVKILSGYSSQDSGRLLLKGREVHFKSVQDAAAHGIETVYQDLALIPQLPVFENLFLNHEILHFGLFHVLNKHKMRELTKRYLDDINVNVPNVNAEAGQLSGGQRQAIAVARATRTNASILLLDEPLAAMGARESRLIIDLVRGLASSRRVSMIIIDHNFAHLFELCDRVNVMQDGHITIDQLTKDTSLEQLTELMVSSYRSQLQNAFGS
ncbi:MAG: ATP-binding cassette domain-containing protein [Acidimicrobiales bacterium]|jgi:ABC-type sugar transport system ATPase subunit